MFFFLMCMNNPVNLDFFLCIVYSLLLKKAVVIVYTWCLCIKAQLLLTKKSHILKSDWGTVIFPDRTAADTHPLSFLDWSSAMRFLGTVCVIK